MNRILTADLILTLTTEDAKLLVCAVRSFYDGKADPIANDGIHELADLIEQQCAKQGVQL
jgi:hypothetical protein